MDMSDANVRMDGHRFLSGWPAAPKPWRRRDGPPLRVRRLRSVPADGHLGDAPALDLEYLEQQIADLDPFADVRHPSEVRQQEAADGFKAFALDFDAKAVADLVDVHFAAEHERSVTFVRHRLALDIVLVADLADDLFEELLDRDQSGGAAVFIHDNGHLHLPPLHLLEQLRHTLALRHQRHRSH